MPTSVADPGAVPRILAIMGSGETAPTMARVHRALFARLGPPLVPAVVLDTPYRFQENAHEITARAIDYFRENVGSPVTLASFRADESDPLRRATAVAQARAARYLFAGPGSPTYALDQWRATEVPSIVADKLAHGGIVVFASAAALTLGSHTVPVYEIYKVGEPPRWLDGLDLLGPFGLPVAVIPHFDNAEGGSHDTRFCYLGEHRLATLETMLPRDHFVLGVDSHTALVLDLGAGTASVLGLGGVTVRADGRHEVFPTGTTVPISALAAAGRNHGGACSAATGAADTRTRATVTDGSPMGDPSRSPINAATLDLGQTPLDREVRDLEERFAGELRDGRIRDAVRAVLSMDQLLLDWSRDTDGTDDLHRARGVFRSLIARLGDRATEADDASSIDRWAPVVALLSELRGRARASGDFQLADTIRDTLVDAGIELRDGTTGTTWRVRRDA